MSKTVELARHLETLHINNMYKTDFYWTWDKTDEEIDAVFTVADALRDLRERNKNTKIFNSGLGISIFRDNSTRTRFSFASACNLLGLEEQVLDEKKSQIAHGETVRETANMVSFMADVIGIRDDMFIGEGHKYQKTFMDALEEGYRDGILEQRPTLVNLQCDVDHPTQCMADMLHIIHYFGGVENLKGKKVAVQSGSNGPAILEEFAPKASQQEFKTDEEAARYQAQINDKAVNNRVYTSSDASAAHLMAGDVRFRDLDGNNIISEGSGTVDDPGDKRIIGNSLPRYNYSFRLGFNWMGFDISAFFQGIGRRDWYPAANQASFDFWGPYAFPPTSFIHKDFYSNCWSEDNRNTYFPRPRGYTALQGTNRELTAVNDRYLQNIGYCRLKNLTVGYTLPRQWTRKALIESLRIYFTGENLFTWSGIRSDYIDPEMAATNGNLRLYPWQRTYMFGVDVTF